MRTRRCSNATLAFNNCFQRTYATSDSSFIIMLKTPFVCFTEASKNTSVSSLVTRLERYYRVVQFYKNMSVRLSAIKDLEGTLLPDSFYQLLGLAQDAAPVRVASSYGTSVRALLLRLPLFFFLFFFFN